jgi:hypothetical protein
MMLILPSCLSKFRACIFSEIAVSNCPSKAIMHDGRSREGSSVEIIARDGNCQKLPDKVSKGISLVLLKITLKKSSFPK